MTIVSGFLQEVSRSTLCQTRWKIEKLSRVLRPSYHLKSIYVLRQTRAILMGMQHLYDRREPRLGSDSRSTRNFFPLGKVPLIRMSCFRFFEVPREASYAGSHWVPPNSKIVTECAGNR